MLLRGQAEYLHIMLKENMFLPAVIDVVILDVAVCAAGVEHLALRVHRHGHNGAVVVPEGLQKVMVKKS